MYHVSTEPCFINSTFYLSGLEGLHFTVELLCVISPYRAIGFYGNAIGGGKYYLKDMPRLAVILIVSKIPLVFVCSPNLGIVSIS